MSKKWLLAIGVSLLAAQAFAAEPASPEDTVRKAVLSIANVKIDSLKPAPMPGYYQVIASGQMVYVSADGKYLFNGDVLDVGSRKNLSDAEWAAFRKAELAKLPVSDRIVFAPEKPRYTVTVFTDVTCTYCRALHKHIEDFNKAGIAVEYVAWPREGVTTTAGRPTDTYKEMVSVWCAADRKSAFTEAKAGKAPKSSNCDNPVKAEYDLGERLGVNGTPMVVAEDGRVLGGYMTPAQMLEKLTNKGS
ncbi:MULTISPECIES: DsbC family protein [Dyella]|uniref:Thiol:disulfide interchange protein n=2 Tax=Dyella TaxID=231454 RepID=A0A4V6NA11_9GAMM|nr:MULTISPECIES: DsbC family protein [Dyella]TBR40282.1 DsbC family protein [Dyella terrae]TCI12137.1 DsbC family protein [Dyella soli]